MIFIQKLDFPIQCFLFKDYELFSSYHDDLNPQNKKISEPKVVHRLKHLMICIIQSHIGIKYIILCPIDFSSIEIMGIDNQLGNNFADVHSTEFDDNRKFCNHISEYKSRYILLLYLLVYKLIITCTPFLSANYNCGNIIFSFNHEDCVKLVNCKTRSYSLYYIILYHMSNFKGTCIIHYHWAALACSWAANCSPHFCVLCFTFLFLLYIFDHLSC